MCRSSRSIARLLGAGALLGVLALVHAAPALAAPQRVRLIRTYDSDTRGLVYEVCEGSFDPPSGDALNPAYCRGTLGRWTQSRWQSYNSRRARAGSGSASKTARPSGHPEAQPQVARGGSKTAGAAEGPAAQIPYGGSLDPTAVLGVENPMCGEPGQLSARQVRNCRSSHSPEAAYPVGNYGWDIHIEAGGFISALFVPAVSFVLQIASVLWLVLLLILKGCLIVLGFAFSLSPFTDNHMLGQISGGLTSLFNRLTSPWLSALFVILGAWGLYNGIVRRKSAETLAGMGAALVMMLGALWIIHSPGATVGRVAAAINSDSLTAVSAPSSGQLSAPVRGYNDAMAAVWNEMTAVPFCAMDFSDVRWCMSARPSDKALEAARGGLGSGDAFTRQLLAKLPSDEKEASRVLHRDLTVLFGPAPTIRDLYLRFSPESGPRDALWDYYNGTPDEHVGLPLEIGPQLDIGGGTSGAAPDKVAMQGRSGVLTRLVLLWIFIIGLIGGLALLLWLAMKLVMATASAFILVLATPLAMFFPVFGRAGRAVFVKWATALLGAVVAKLIFSGLLGIVLLGSSVIGSSIGRSSPTLGLIATMAFWWAAFLSREKYLAVLQVNPVADQGMGVYRALAGGYLGYRVAKAAKGAIGSFREERSARSQRRRTEESRTQAETRRKRAEQRLDGQAHQRLDAETSEARSRESSRSATEREAQVLREDPDVRALRQDPERVPESARAPAQAKAARLSQLQKRLGASQAQSRSDRRLLERVRANEAAGLPRHGAAEIKEAKEAIRREASLPDDAREHRWRARAAGHEPESPEGREAIAQSLSTTREAIGTSAPERLEQVDLHRRRGSGGDQRRPESGLRRPARPPSGKGSKDGTQKQPERPPAERRSRVRKWLSR